MELSKKQIERQKRFIKKHPKYHEFSMKHPWLPGLYLIMAGIILILMWYFGIAKSSSLYLFRAIHNILHIIGAFSILYGAYIIFEFLKNPEEARKKAKAWSKKILKS